MRVGAAVAGWKGVPQILTSIADSFLNIVISSNDRNGGSALYKIMNADGTHVQNMAPIPNLDPHHFIVPYLSKRKTSSYQEDVRSEFTLRISTDMTYLAAKLPRLTNPSFPDRERYSETCKAILGFVVTAIPSANGLHPGVYLPDRQTIPIDQMGEGVPNIVALLADLALSEGKLFLIDFSD